MMSDPARIQSTATAHPLYCHRAQPPYTHRTASIFTALPSILPVELAALPCRPCTVSLLHSIAVAPSQHSLCHCTVHCISTAPSPLLLHRTLFCIFTALFPCCTALSSSLHKALHKTTLPYLACCCTTVPLLHHHCLPRTAAASPLQGERQIDSASEASSPPSTAPIFALLVQQKLQDHLRVQ